MAVPQLKAVMIQMTCGFFNPKPDLFMGPIDTLLRGLCEIAARDSASGFISPDFSVAFDVSSLTR